jgi:hypothetical protein
MDEFLLKLLVVFALRGVLETLAHEFVRAPAQLGVG